jgi:hypothetical protein
MRSFMISSAPQYFSGDKIEENELGGPCSTYGGEERRVQWFGSLKNFSLISWASMLILPKIIRAIFRVLDSWNRVG